MCAGPLSSLPFLLSYDLTHLPIVAPISGSNVSSVNLKRRLKEREEGK